MQDVMDFANKNVQERMKGPYHCSKLFGTQRRPKTVTLSSYNTLTQETHRNFCVINDMWIFFQGNHYFQSLYSLFQTLKFFHELRLKDL